MLPAPIPANEPERLASLRRMLLLSTPDEAAFDRVTRTAQRLFKVPIALVSLIDANRQWFKSCVGLPVRETGRDVSFCGHAILEDRLFVIENARADSRFADNPLVTGAPHVIFYAGRPLRNAEGHRVGTLCIIDHEPRAFGDQDRQTLDDLGFWIEHIFLGRELSQSQRTMLEELDDVRRRSMLDPLLNIWTRQALDYMLEREVLRAFRSHSPLAVAVVRANWTGSSGEQHAEAIRIEWAKRMRAAIRAYDNLGRAGDDTLMVVLPDADPTVARQILERIRNNATHPMLIGEEVVDLELQAGVCLADFVTSTPEPATLVRLAEEALAEALREPGAIVYRVAEGDASP